MTQSRLIPKLWVSGSVPMLSVYAFVARTVTALLILLFVECNHFINWLDKLFHRSSRNCGSAVLLWIRLWNVVGKRQKSEVCQFINNRNIQDGPIVWSKPKILAPYLRIPISVPKWMRKGGVSASKLGELQAVTASVWSRNFFAVEVAGRRRPVRMSH